VKSQSVVPSWAGSSKVVVGATRVVLPGVFVWSTACCRRVLMIITY